MKFAEEGLLAAFLILWILAWVCGSAAALSHRRFLSLFLGVITIGLVWLPGLSRRVVSPGSRIHAAAAGLLAASILLGLFVCRPVPVVGASREAVESSVEAGGAPHPCITTDGNGSWRCEIPSADFSGTVQYLVSVGWTGCWTARRIGPAVSDAPPEKQGCIRLFDLA